MARLPTGSTFWIVPAASIAAAKNTTIVTNATEAVVTSAAHGYSNGDVVLVFSGWGRLNKRAFRIKSVTTDTFVLERCNTSNTNFYPAGQGIGTVKKINAFTQIVNTMRPQASGGDPKPVTYRFTESDVEYTINDGFTATNYSLEVDADSIDTVGWQALQDLTEVQTDTVLKIVAKSGATQYIPCTVAANDAEQFADGQIVSNKVSFSGNNRLVRYPA
jgi:hypothetical protein